MSRINIFCLPFAGGSKYSYNEYSNIVSDEIRLIPIEIPGRGSRIRETLCTDIDHIVHDIFHQIKDRLDEPYAIYGHSMGALLGYLLTKQISRHALNFPKHLIFTGRKAPSVSNKKAFTYLLPKAEFVKELVVLGGSPAEVLDNEDLINFYEPIIRADFMAVENYKYEASPPLDIPITVMFGTEEDFTRAQAEAWQRETTTRLELIQFPGGHFFIYQYAKQIVEIITKTLSQYNNGISANVSEA